MKKFFLVVLASFLWLTPALAEQIDTYDVRFKVNEDGTFTVHENILYDFETLERHGIYRDIPFEYDSSFWMKKRIDIENVSVKNEKNISYTFELSNENGSKRIKIGDANRLITGKKTYSIDYTVDGAVLFNEGTDVINWNAIGNDWAVPIQSGQVQIEVAGKIAPALLQTQCFQGEFSSVEPCKKNTDNIFTVQNLDPHSGMTVQLQFPAGTFPRPSQASQWISIVVTSWPIAIPILTFIFLFWRWWKTGRDPKGRGTIIPEFDAPDNLTPAQVGSLYDEKMTQKDVSSEIIFLAQQGYLRIVQEDKKGLFGKEKFTLEKLKDQATLNNSFDKMLMQALFLGKDVQENGVLARVSLDDLKYTFSQNYVQVANDIQKSLVSGGYFAKDPQTVRSIYMIIGIALNGVLAFLGLKVFTDTNTLLLILGALFGAALFLFFAPLMPARTAKGVLTREHILGLKQYLSVAEKDRINFHNAPEKKPQTFEKFLPYAMVLGVETQWAKYFEDMYKDMQPSWYVSNSGAHFNAILLSQSLHNFSAVSGTTLATPPASKGGGSGGFSGGGFGGGGGGSW